MVSVLVVKLELVVEYVPHMKREDRRETSTGTPACLLRVEEGKFMLHKLDEGNGRMLLQTDPCPACTSQSGSVSSSFNPYPGDL